MCFAPRQADFHPITSVSSSWVFSSDRVIMPGLCAARRALASDQKGPFHNHEKGTAQERSRVGGVTLLLHLSGSGKQACQFSGEFDSSGCCFQNELVKTLLRWRWVLLLNSLIAKSQILLFFCVFSCSCTKVYFRYFHMIYNLGPELKKFLNNLYVRRAKQSHKITCGFNFFGLWFAGCFGCTLKRKYFRWYTLGKFYSKL